MRPLYWISAGLAVVIFTEAPDDRFDVSDILGQLFVLLGWVRLSRALPRLPLRLTLWYLCVLALAVACALAAPEARAWRDDADPAVIWASSLPALGFQAALCHALARQAREAGARRASWWWTAAEVAILVAILANILYDGAGWTWLYGTGSVGLVGVFLVIALGIAYGPAAWAGATEPPDPETPDPDASGPGSKDPDAPGPERPAQR